MNIAEASEIGGDSSAVSNILDKLVSASPDRDEPKQQQSSAVVVDVGQQQGRQLLDDLSRDNETVSHPGKVETEKVEKAQPETAADEPEQVNKDVLDQLLAEEDRGNSDA